MNRPFIFTILPDPAKILFEDMSNSHNDFVFSPKIDHNSGHALLESKFKKVWVIYLIIHRNQPVSFASIMERF